MEITIRNLGTTKKGNPSATDTNGTFYLVDKTVAGLMANVGYTVTTKQLQIGDKSIPVILTAVPSGTGTATPSAAPAPASDKKDKMIAKMNCFTNATNLSIAYLELLKVTVKADEPKEVLDGLLNKVELFRDGLARTYYKNITGEDWENFEAEIPF